MRRGCSSTRCSAPLATRAVRAVVVTGERKLFSAGADLGEFAAGTAMDAPTLHGDIVPLMATLLKPVVAAVRGAALGGGLELALGCHDRVFAAGTRLGLPETTLGLMPGAGGTQWLPRAIGLDAATDLIVSGRVEPVEAVAGSALAHAIVPPEGLLARPRPARRAGATARRRRDRFARSTTRPIVDDAVANAAGRLAGRLNAQAGTLSGVLRALDAIALTTVDVRRRGNARRVRIVRAAARKRRVAGASSRVPGRAAAQDPTPTSIVSSALSRIVSAPGSSGNALRSFAADATVAAVARATLRWRSHPDAGEEQADEPAIAVRLLGAIIDEGRTMLEAGEAASESDLDLALVRSGDFARVQGGPFFQARILGIDRLREAV